MESEPGDRDLDPRVARTRAAVARAVRQVIVEDGIEGLTHARVAEVAGVGRASVYRHWPDRVDLVLDAVADQGSSDLLAEPSDATDVAAELGRLQQILNDSPFVPQIAALIGRAEWEPVLQDVKLRLAQRGTARLRAAVAATVERGELPEDTDLDGAVARLAGPLFFRRLLLSSPITDDFVHESVASFRPGGCAPDLS